MGDERNVTAGAGRGGDGAVSANAGLGSDHRTRVARLLLATFLLTFLCSRILVLLIMTRRAPDLYLYAGQTHVHHLNYGIFLLSGVGAYLLFFPRPRQRAWVVVLYGVGLALTFDEFGMWLHLGGGYWQRARRRDGDRLRPRPDRCGPGAGAVPSEALGDRPAVAGAAGGVRRAGDGCLPLRRPPTVAGAAPDRAGRPAVSGSILADTADSGC